MKKLRNTVELSLEDMNKKLYKYKKIFCIEVFTIPSRHNNKYGRPATTYLFSRSEEIKELMLKIWFGGGHAVIWTKGNEDNKSVSYVTDLHTIKDFHSFEDIFPS